MEDSSCRMTSDRCPAGYRWAVEGKATAWERLTRIDVRIWDGLLAAAALVNAQLDLWMARDVGPGVREPDLLAAALLVVATVPLYARRRRPLATAAVVAAAVIAFGALHRPATETFLSLVVGGVLDRRLPAPLHRPNDRAPGSPRGIRRVLGGCEHQLGRDGERRVLHGGSPVRDRSDRVEPASTPRSGARAGGARCRGARTEPDRARAARRRRAQHERDGRAGGGGAVGPPSRPGRGRAGAPLDRGVRADRSGGDAPAPRRRAARSEPSLVAAARRSTGSTSCSSAMRATGLDVELVVEGEPRPLAAGVDLSAYRIVQEALTNALKHGGDGVHARVVLRYDDGEIDRRGRRRRARAGDGRRRRRGRGLIGMRERVAFVGGDLETGCSSGRRVRRPRADPVGRAGRPAAVTIRVVDRGRPGAHAWWVPHDPRRRGRHRGGRRGDRRRGRAPAVRDHEAGRRGDGRPDAHDGRDRGDTPAH